MLVLSRLEGQEIKIGSTVRVKILRTGRETKIGIDAPRNVKILRAEIEGRDTRSDSVKSFDELIEIVEDVRDSLSRFGKFIPRIRTQGMRHVYALRHAEAAEDLIKAVESLDEYAAHYLSDIDG